MLKWLIASSLRFRSIVVVVAAGLLILGAVVLRDKPFEILPEFSPLSLTVQTESLGLSSAEVESLITVPLEADLLNGVPWLESIQSESMAGLSRIEMVFTPGTDLMKARQLVQERLTQARALPNVSSPPVMQQPISSTGRILNIGLSSKSISLIDMSVQARWNIVPRLASVPGVANVSVWGQRERQLQVHVDARALQTRGIKFEQVIKTAGEAVWSSPLTYLNSSTPGTGGFVETPNQRLNIRHILPITTTQAFSEVPVSGTTVRIGDVAHVLEAHQALIGDAIIGEGPGLMLAIDKFPDFNTLEVTRGVERALEELKPGLPGIEIDSSIYRPASFIERATKNLVKAVIISLILAAAMLGLLMGHWRPAVIALAAILLSVVSTALLLQAAGITLNMMVIAGLLMAAGAIVHDGIIDIDNVFRRLRPPGAGRSGALVIARSILQTRRPMVYASLIVVLAVLPILSMHRRSAEFFAPMIWTYIAAIIVSMAVALMATPALAALLLDHDRASPQGYRPMNKLAGLFDRLVGAAARAPFACLAASVVAAVSCIALWGMIEREIVPRFNETDVVIEWQGPPGTSLPAMTRSTDGLIRDLRKIPGVRNASANLGRAFLCTCERARDVNAGEVWVSIDPKADYEETVDALENAVSTYPGMRGQIGTYLSTKLRAQLTGDSDDITVRVYGPNLEIVRAKAEEIRASMAMIPGIENPLVELQTEEPAIEIKADLDRAAQYGLKPGDIRRAASLMIGGITVGALFEDQKIFDVVVWSGPEMRGSIDDVRNIMINSENGSQVRLAQVADIRIAPAISTIRRQGSARRIDVTAKVDGRSRGDVAKDVAKSVGQVTFPLEHHAEVLGEYKERNAALQSIYSYMAAAALLMFLLMQAALRGWRLAALSLLGVPIAVAGGFVSILIAGSDFSLGSVLGLVAVLAVMVRQGISLVAHLQNLQLRGGELLGEGLVLRGVREQFPSLITSAVTIFVLMLPFAFSSETAGLEIVGPLAVVVLGGIVTSTLGILLVLPALYLRFGSAWSVGRLDLGLDAKP